MIRARVLSFIAWLIVSIWTRSIRVRLVNSSVRERFHAEGRNFVYAFWHGSMVLLLHPRCSTKVTIPVSESADGEIMAGVLKRFGFGVVRGSSSRNGHRALLAMICGARRGESVGIAVDGPRGPLHEAKKGVAYLSAKLNMPIIPVAAAPRRFKVLESTWEKLVLPAPFTQAVVLFGEPVIIPGISEEEIERGRRKLEQALRSLTSEAQELAASDAGDVRERLYGTQTCG